MTVVNTLKTNSQTYTYEQLQAMMANGTLDSSTVKNVSVFSQSADSSACTDGKDDGKIGFFGAIGSAIKGAVKGVVNGIKGMFTDENGKFSLGQTLKTVVTGAACMIPGVGPFIAGGLCAYGAVKGVTGIVKGAQAAANATTDAEAKAAWESIGSNTLTTGLSVVGLKGAVSQIAKNAGVAGNTFTENVKNLTSKSNGGLKTTLKDSVNLKGIEGKSNYYSSAWDKAVEGKTGLTKYVDGAKAVVNKGATGTWENIQNVYGTVREKAGEMKDAAGKKAGEMKDAMTNKGTGKGADAPKGAKAPKVKMSTKIRNGVKGIRNGATQTTKFLGEHYGVTGVLASQTAKASEDMLNAVPYQSQTYATVDTQTGRYFELEDYTLPTNLDQKYTEIMSATNRF